MARVSWLRRAKIGGMRSTGQYDAKIGGDPTQNPPFPDRIATPPGSTFGKAASPRQPDSDLLRRCHDDRYGECSCPDRPPVVVAPQPTRLSQHIVEIVSDSGEGAQKLIDDRVALCPSCGARNRWIRLRVADADFIALASLGE